MFSLSRRSGSLLAATGIALSAAGGLVAPAQAATTHTTLSFACTYPLVGAPIPLSVAFDTTPTGGIQPSSVSIGIDGVFTPGGGSLDPFVTSVDGSARITTSFDSGGVNLPVTFPMALSSSTDPTAPVGTMIGHASTPALTPAGSQYSLSLKKLALNLRFKDFSGSPIPDIPNPTGVPASDTDPNTVDVPCTLSPATQDTYLIKPPVIGPLPPSISAMSPTHGPAAGGNQVTLTSGFHSGSITNVTFGGTPAAIVSQDQSTTVVVAPPGAAGSTVDVVQSGTSGASTNTPADDYTYDAAAVGPTAPGAPTVKSITRVPSNPLGGRVELTWAPSQSAVGIDHYTVFSGGDPVGTTTGITLTVPFADFPTYIFTVQATDVNGVVSPVSAPLSFKAPTQTPTPPPTETTVNYSYAIAGSATLKNLVKGSLPLSGSIDATLGVQSGNFTGNLKLATSTANLTALGFLPVTATVNIVPTEAVTGHLTSPAPATGPNLTALAKVRIKLPSIKTFGIQLAGGANCQATQVSNIPLTSTGFVPLKGGVLAGTFSISNLSGCGALNGVVSPLTAGSGNTIALSLTRPPVV